MIGNVSFALSLFILIAACESANILVIVSFTSTSHYKVLRPIGLELARRGHNVTVITAHEETNPPPNYHQIMVDDIKIWEAAEGGRPNVFDMVQLSFEKFTELILWNGGLFTTENTLKSKSVVKFMEEEHHFDLVISELFYQEALYMFAHKYKTPLVLMNTYGNCMRANFIMRNPLQLSTVMPEFARIRDPKSFIGRLTNVYYTTYDIFWTYWWYMPAQEALVKKYFRNLTEPVPSLFELNRNVSLVLMNSHYSYDTPAAYYPNFVEIGGLHSNEFDQDLPQDIQKFLDDAEHGVVYVNFGSNVRSSELPPHKRDAFLNVFSRLKQKVLFKWEDTELPNKPSNVEVRKWLPQKEILGHPNVKLFVSHGGLIGFQEAIVNKVPTLGVPIYADQYNNLLQGKEQGFASILEFEDINDISLETAIVEMLNNDKYKKNIEIVSERFKDRPLSPLNTSMYWIEYVLRHKGASFMRSPAIEMSWISYMMIDVFAFLMIMIFVALALVYKVFKFLRTSMKRDKIKRS